MTTRNKYSIGQAVRKLSHKVKPQLLLAEVKSVNKQTGKLTVDCAFLGLENVKIDYHPATSSGNQYILYPAVGSMVVIGRLEGSDQLFVLSVIVPDEVWLRGGEWSAVKGEKLKSEVEKLKAALEQIKTAIQNASVAPGDGGTAFKANIMLGLTPFNTGDFSGVLNEKVKHG